jgi:hypothetical protein
MHFKLLEKQEPTEPQISRWKEILKIRAEINKMVTKNNIIKQKCWFFENTSKFDKALVKEGG